MKIILDTNIWISFMLGGHASAVGNLLASQKVRVHVCRELMLEFLDVANRPKIRKHVSERNVEDTLAVMQTYCEESEIKSEATSKVRDSNDLFLLSLAESVGADYIVTGDYDLLVLGKHGKAAIVTLSEFLKIFD